MSTEMKVFLWITCVLAIAVCVDSTAELIYDKISVATGAGFVQYINFDTGEEVLECALNYSDGSDKVTIQLPVNDDLILDKTNVFYERLKSLGNGLCGITVNGIKQSDPAVYQLTVKYKINGITKTEDFEFEIVLYDRVKQSKTIKYVKLGTVISIDCPKPTQEQHCILYDPANRVVQSGATCAYTIREARLEHEGDWKCVSSVLFSMESATNVVRIKFMEKDTVDTWFKTENGLAKLGCQFKSGNPDAKLSSLKYCSFQKPQGDVLIITPGIATERYASMGTDLSNYICQIEFKFPLQDSEFGNWRCMLDKLGGFIEVESPTQRMSVQESNYQLENKLYVTINSSFDIQCSVPYSSENCYIKSPSGDIYQSAGASESTLGWCRLSIPKASEEDYGKWSCYFSRPDQPVDDVYAIEVLSPNRIVATVTEIRVDQDAPVELMCGSQSPIAYCRFLDPHGISYHVSPEKAKVNGLVYVGAGLEQGDCGISIEKAQTYHAGVWTCYVKGISSSAEEFNTIKISLNSSAISHAAAIGLPIGIVAVVLLILVVAIVHKYRKEKQETSERRRSRESDEDNVRIPFASSSSAGNYSETINTIALNQY